MVMLKLLYKFSLIFLWSLTSSCLIYVSLRRRSAAAYMAGYLKTVTHAILSPYAVNLHLYTCTGAGAHTGWPSVCSAEERYNNNKYMSSHSSTDYKAPKFDIKLHNYVLCLFTDHKSTDPRERTCVGHIHAKRTLFYTVHILNIWFTFFMFFSTKSENLLQNPKQNEYSQQPLSLHNCISITLWNSSRHKKEK